MTSRSSLICVSRWATVLLLTIPLTTLEAQRKRPPAFSTKAAAVDSVYASRPTISPDGKWLAFETVATGWTAIAIAPAGGGPQRWLTPQSALSTDPVWFPSGDRIAYVSDRMGGIVVSDFDTKSGTLVGSPSRITIERTSNFDISPDGKWIAYATPVEQARNLLRLVPSNGGRARTLFDSGRVFVPRFSADGRHVYVANVPARQGNVALVRVPVNGGAASEVLKAATGRFFNVVVDPARSRVMQVTNDDRYVLTTFTGDTIAKFSAGDDVGNRGGTFSPDGASFYTTRFDGGAAIRLAAATGGETRDLSDSLAYNWPIAWTSDAKRVFFVGDSATLLLSADLEGRVTQIPIAPRAGFADTARISLSGVSGDGRYVWFHRRQSGRPELIHSIYDTETRETRDITRTGGPLTPAGPGGSWLRYSHASKEFFYIDRKPHGRELRAIVPAGGSSRLVRTLPMSADSATSIAVHGDRVMWIEGRGGATSIILATDASSPARRVWTGKGLSQVVWSHDGGSIAAIANATQADNRSRTTVVFFDVAADGKLTETGRSAPVRDPWDLHWTPDDKAVTLLEYQGPGNDTRVARVPRQAGDPITYILRPGAATFWDQFPSPDGKHVVVPAEVTRGSSILRIDLKAAEDAYRRGVAQGNGNRR